MFEKGGGGVSGRGGRELLSLLYLSISSSKESFSARGLFFLTGTGCRGVNGIPPLPSSPPPLLPPPPSSSESLLIGCFNFSSLFSISEI